MQFHQPKCIFPFHAFALITLCLSFSFIVLTSQQPSMPSLLFRLSANRIHGSLCPLRTLLPHLQSLLYLLLWQSKLKKKVTQWKNGLFWFIVWGCGPSWQEGVRTGTWNSRPYHIHSQEAKTNASAQCAFYFDSGQQLSQWDRAFHILLLHLPSTIKSPWKCPKRLHSEVYVCSRWS